MKKPSCAKKKAPVVALSLRVVFVVFVVVCVVVVVSVGALFVPGFGRVTRKGPATTHPGPCVSLAEG